MTDAPDSWKARVGDLLASTFYNHKKPLAICDTECTPNFWSIGFLRVNDGKLVIMEKSARKELDVERLRSIMLTHTIITYNGMGYDMPMIWLAINGATNAQLKAANDRIIVGRLKYWECEAALGVTVPYKCTHIDLMEPQPNAFASLKTLQGRLHGKKMQDLPFHPDQHLSHEEMDTTLAYMGNDLEATLNVLIALREPLELRATAGLEFDANFLSKSDSQMGESIIKKRVEAITGEKIQRVVTPAGTTFPYRPPEFTKMFQTPELREIVDRLAQTQFIVQADGKVDLPQWLEGKQITIDGTTYALGIGGLHSTESNRAVLSDDEYTLVDADVESQYPNIILSLGLYPKATGPAGMIAYAAVKDDRIGAKNRVKEIDKEIEAPRSHKADSDEAKQIIKKAYVALNKEKSEQKNKDQSYKIALNGGFFGKLGSVYSVLYAPHLLIATTLTGQLSLLLLIEMASRAGIGVVSGNTDGVVFRCPRHLAAKVGTGTASSEGVLIDICREWEKATSFKLEFATYTAIYNQSVNTYIAIKEDGKVKRKGTLANPYKEDMRSQLMKNPNMGVCSDAVVEFLTKGTPIEGYIRAATDVRDFITVVNVQGGGTWRDQYLGKVVRYYWSTEGTEILYKNPHPTTGNFKKVSKTDGCKPMMELADELPADIDYDRYIEAAHEILMDIGVDERPEPIKPLRIFKYNAVAWFAVAAA